MKEVCREIGALVPCDRISLALPAGDGGGFVVTTLHPEDGHAAAWEIPGDESCAALVLRRRRAEVLSDLGTEYRHPEEEALCRQGFRSAALLPLYVGGEPFGVLILAGREPHCIERRVVRLLERVGGLAAAALAAAAAPPTAPGLEGAGGLDAFSVVSARIAREEDLNQICRIFLDTIREHSGFGRAVLTLLDEQGKEVQWFFTGLSDAEIDHFHRHRMSSEQLRSLLMEKLRHGNSYRIERSAAPNGAGLPAAPEAAGPRRAGGGAGGDLLIVPLHGAGGVLLGTLMLDLPLAGAARAVPRPALELFTCQMAHVLEKRRLDREVKRTQSRLRATQEQLMQADKMSAIGQLISGVAHELNNPLSGIMGFAQLLQSGEIHPQARRSLERIQNEATRCQKIVQNLLSFSRRHKPETTYCSLGDVIDSVLELRAYQLQVDDVRVERRYAPRLAKTMLDYHQLQQVILNLVNNAHQAMMSVTDRERCLRITTEQEGDRIRAHISDSGPGIPQDRQARIFEPFYTTKESGKGTGLGLSLSLAIVKDHQGTMGVESDLGEGTTITIELPRIEGEKTDAAPAQPPAAAQRARPLRLLVVDDEEVLTDLLTDFLKGEGHQVDQARDGRSALRMATHTTYDVILSDLKMPGLDGQGLYERLCQVKPEMKERFVFSTGDLANPRVQTFFQATGCRYFSKPFRLESVLSVLNQVARGARAA